MGRHNHANIHATLDDFITKLKRRRPESSLALARHTIEVLIHAVAAQQAPTVEGIVEGMRAVGKKLTDARPLELVVGNMCRRVLHIIREEAEHGRPGHGDADDASDDASGSDSDEGESLGKMKKFKSEVIEVIHELIDELESSSAHITSQALEHVSPSSVVLTSGGDELVEAFLREANRKRKFQAVVADGGASRGGHRLARALAEKGVETTAISDAAVFAMMSRVNLVVIAARGVFSNGGVLASAGDLGVAVAAKHHAVPVVVLAGTHELSPLGPGDPEFEMNDLLSPAEVLDYTALADCLPSAAGEGGGGGGGTGEGAGGRGRGGRVAGRGAPGV